jgi:hypothetical protein
MQNGGTSSEPLRLEGGEALKRISEATLEEIIPVHRRVILAEFI